MAKLPIFQKHTFFFYSRDGCNQEENAINEGEKHVLPNVLTFKLQAETDDLYQRCSNFTNVAKEANTTSDKLDAEIRDLSKKVPNNWDKYIKHLGNLEKYYLQFGQIHFAMS